MDPVEHDFEIYRGTTWERSLTLESSPGVVADLSAYTARMTFYVEGGASFLTLTSGGGGIILAATSPNIAIVITSVQTDAIAQSAGVYRLNITSPSGTVSALLKGHVRILPENLT